MARATLLALLALHLAVVVGTPVTADRTTGGWPNASMPAGFGSGEFKLLSSDAVCTGDLLHKWGVALIEGRTRRGAASCAEECSARVTCRFVEWRAARRECGLYAGCQLRPRVGTEVWVRRPFGWGTTEHAENCFVRPPLNARLAQLQPVAGQSSTARAATVMVAISLAVFENDAWVEALVLNAMRFTLPSTASCYI